MSEFHLKRRIPPNTEEELLQHLVDNTDLKVWEARAIAKEQHAANMEAIYRLARIGATFERMRPYGEDDLQLVTKDATEHWQQYWTGVGDGWNGARQWVIDNVEEA